MILLIRRKWVLGATALLLAVVSLLSLAERPRAAIPAFSYDALPTREVVIIDAGHGGSRRRCCIDGRYAGKRHQSGGCPASAGFSRLDRLSDGIDSDRRGVAG